MLLEMKVLLEQGSQNIDLKQCTAEYTESIVTLHLIFMSVLDTLDSGYHSGSASVCFLFTTVACGECCAKPFIQKYTRLIHELKMRYSRILHATCICIYWKPYNWTYIGYLGTGGKRTFKVREGESILLWIRRGKP